MGIRYILESRSEDCMARGLGGGFKIEKCSGGRCERHKVVHAPQVRVGLER